MAASGFSKKHQEEFDKLFVEHATNEEEVDPNAARGGDEEDEDEEDEEDDEEDEDGEGEGSGAKVIIGDLPKDVDVDEEEEEEEDDDDDDDNEGGNETDEDGDGDEEDQEDGADAKEVNCTFSLASLKWTLTTVAFKRQPDKTAFPRILPAGPSGTWSQRDRVRVYQVTTLLLSSTR